MANLNALPKSYYIGMLKSTQTLAQQVISFASTHIGEAGIQVKFSVTSSGAPSDLPDQTATWKYAFGELKVRAVDGNGVVDGMIFIYGFGSNTFAVKAVANSGAAGEWKIFS